LVLKKHSTPTTEFKKNKMITALIAFGVSLGLINCSPNAAQLKEVIKKDPSIVFAAIEASPEQFIEVVNKAAQKAQAKGAEKGQEEEKKKRDEEFAKPLVPKIEEGRPFEGPKDAPITLVEFSDFQCPYCSRGFQTVKEVMAAYPGKIRFVFKHLPLDFHPMAMPAAKYFEAIARQSGDMAYKFHDAVFTNQGDLGGKKEAFLKDMAKKVGADLKKLAKDLDDPKLMERITADMEEAKSFEMSGTPGFLINGVSLRGAYPASEFKEIIDRHLAAVK
jgi:protein-disulfide isomerase